ncbi:amidohydrolase family protein [Sphingomonas canadensis]|uniref:Amidohydrolase family protein n=1 Tax=Sphingomonas canadensis TaxID=1219257 RepID=A0ABW3HA68_9SPHN|nr:amidohydrolase family protein [Sphingomonas canadensis]MCW3838100.1 amidohydrolase family protein [Sphingomonas canadensis]
MKLKRPALLAALLACAAIQPAYADTLIHAGRVIDGVSDTVRTRATIVVKDGRILRIDDGFTVPGKDDEVIDLSTSTVMPGLFDMHTHLVADGTSAFTDGFTMGPADLVLKAEVNARVTLLAGFTAVRDLGDSYNVTVALKKAVEGGKIVGPHIFTATAALSSTGGHGDPTNGLAPALRFETGPKDGVVDSPEDAVKAVRERYKDGADVIKVMATGGVMSMERDAHGAQMTQAELNAIVSTARDYGMPVAAHAHGTDGILRAVRAGVGSIEHGTYLDDETIRLMKEKGTFLVPTLMAGEWITEKAKIDGALPPVIRPKAAQIGPLMSANFTRALKAGVKIMFGTDSGVSAHGDNAHEFELMVQAGMRPMDAIRSATSVAAGFLNVGDRYGSVAVGKQADLIAVPGDPIADIGQMRRVSFVMLGGKIVKGGK